MSQAFFYSFLKSTKLVSLRASNNIWFKNLWHQYVNRCEFCQRMKGKAEWILNAFCGYLLVPVGTSWHMLVPVGICWYLLVSDQQYWVSGRQRTAKKLDLFVISKHCVEQHLKLFYHFRIHSARGFGWRSGSCLVAKWSWWRPLRRKLYSSTSCRRIIPQSFQYKLLYLLFRHN